MWLVAMDPSVGSKIQRTRPCLVSPDEMNGIVRRIIVAPLTSGSHPAPFRVSSTFGEKPGLVLLDQIRTVDRKRLVKRQGRIDSSTLESVLNVLTRMFSI